MPSIPSGRRAVKATAWETPAVSCMYSALEQIQRHLLFDIEDVLDEETQTLHLRTEPTITFSQTKEIEVA